MTDDDGFRLEAAMQIGATTIEGSDSNAYSLSEVELIAFAKACERKGRAEAMQVVRRELNNPLNAKAQSPLLSVLGALKKRNDETDAELAPILEAERQRVLVRSKPESLCEDEGCPHHGTAHVCVTSPPDLCEGGQPINSEPCSLCGATMDDSCRLVRVP